MNFKGPSCLMDEIKEFVDERQKTWCIHCARTLASRPTNRDHVPTKSLLRPPLPGNLPVVEVCTECNESFSRDEQYTVAFLGAVISGTTDPERQIHSRAGSILRKASALRARIDASRIVTRDLFGVETVTWKPEQDRINNVILKNARCHAFFEFGEPMLNSPASVASCPLSTLSVKERSAFESNPDGGVFPEVGSRMMTRVLTGQDLDGDWVVVQDGVYRYAVAQAGTLMVRSVIFEYLATEVCWR